MLAVTQLLRGGFNPVQSPRSVKRCVDYRLPEYRRPTRLQAPRGQMLPMLLLMTA